MGEALVLGAGANHFALAAGDVDYAMYRSHYPRLGRFTSPDPVAGSITDPQSLNRYAYTRNDPVNLTDPLGLDPVLCFWNGWGIVCNGSPGSGGGGSGSGAPSPLGIGDTSWWWSFFDASNPVGVQSVLDLGGTMANAATRGAMGPLWNLLPGNYNAVAEDEARYEEQVLKGLENLQKREGEEERARNPEEWERQEKCANELVPQLVQANGLEGKIELGPITVESNYKITFIFSIIPDTAVPRQTRFGSRPGLELNWREGRGDVDARQYRGDVVSGLAHGSQVFREKILRIFGARPEKPCNLLAAFNKRKKK